MVVSLLQGGGKGKVELLEAVLALMLSVEAKIRYHFNNTVSTFAPQIL
jgi:hypothetical protein